MASKPAKIADRSKGKGGGGVDILFGGSAQEKQPSPNAEEQVVAEHEQHRAATFNLYSRHQDFLDDFVRSGKRQFRRKSSVGVGAINKSVVLQELLEVLQADRELQTKIITNLEHKAREEGSRHNPKKKSRT